MKLHELPKGKSKKTKHRVGRGHGSGWGKTAGRGQKGQKSRSDGNIHPAFQGGGISMFRRFPKLGGFRSINRVEYLAVNLSVLNKFDDGAEITPETLREAGIMKNSEKL
ncbi:MAG: 50S ribosomal protein L15, partial [bacterium]